MTRRGQVLPIVMITLVVLTIIITSLVRWLQEDNRWTVKEQKSTDATNLAEAGLDRGTWKLQSSTFTWGAASTGLALAGYNFDVTYTDVPGGTYRIKFASGTALNGLPTVTITAEGRDSAKKETRALQSLVVNQTLYSALMSGGNVSWAKGLVVWWGPIMSQGNIQLMDDTVASLYFPRKFAKGVVIGTAANPRDVNGLQPPNTDNAEWWSEYNGVPPVPILDFVSLRSSAAATGTLNVYGCRSTQGGAGTSGSATKWDIRASCASGGSHLTHFGNPWSHPKSPQYQPNTDYVWYWDGDVTLSGTWCGTSPCGQSTGLRGTIIVRGNLTIDTPGEYNYTGHVPSNAWVEEGKLTQSTFDSSASGEYPADTGLHSSASTFNFGTDSWCQPTQGCGWQATVGLKGFTYVGGNLTINQFLDFHGSVWVNGNVIATGGTTTTFCSIYYDDTLQVPSLNVILLRSSWKEVAASSTVWP